MSLLNTTKSMNETRGVSTAAIKKLLVVLAASILVGLASHIIVPLPFTPVPLSMAPFAVLLIGLVLTPRMAFAALSAYLLEGAMGLPFFAPNGPGGLAHLLWPTAGYLVAFPVAAYCIAKIYRALNRSLAAALIATAAGSLVLFVIGASWLGLALHLNGTAALAAGVLPFLAGDAAKILAASLAAQAWKRIRN